MNATSLLLSQSTITRFFALMMFALALLQPLIFAGFRSACFRVPCFRKASWDAEPDQRSNLHLDKSSGRSTLSYLIIISVLLLGSFNAKADSDIRIDESFEHILINHNSSITQAPDSATYFDVLEGASAF
jgi:hypothetical protein